CVVDARGEALSSVVVQLVGGSTALLPIPPAASGLRGARPWPVRVRAALVCTRQSLMLRVTPTALTRPAEGRHVLLPPPPVRRRASGNGRVCASPSPGLLCRGPSRLPPRPPGFRGRASWRAACPRPRIAPPLRDPDAHGIFPPARAGDPAQLRRAAPTPRAAPASSPYRAPACRSGTSPARTARPRGWRGSAWNRPGRDWGSPPDRRRTGSTFRRAWRGRW